MARATGVLERCPEGGLVFGAVVIFDSDPPPEAPASIHALPVQRGKPMKAKAPSRASLKHFGGYVGDDTLEKIALLRVRLKKSNSELMELAIEELHRKHNAKRAFGDA